MNASLDALPGRARRLCELSLARLPHFIDEASGLFAFRADGEEMKKAGTSVRYTAMTLLGLERALEHGFTSDIDLDKVDAALDRALPGVVNSGDIGLIVWAAARRNKALATRALDRLMDFGPLTREKDGRAYHGTELAWVVTGLCEALAHDLGNHQAVRTRLDEAYERLLDLRGASGLIAFARPLHPAHEPKTGMDVREHLKANLGFFDAQVYSTIAMLKRSQVANDPIAKVFAKVIGETILKHQRSMGQWAWHYNVESGSLVDLYPVYSVHQDGMAPMCLYPLAKATGLVVEPAIARGVNWLFGDNELGVPMVDEINNRIWRSIRRKQPYRNVVYPLKALSLANVGGSLDLAARLADPEHLEVDREFRPYHLGWCLYAFADVAARARDEVPKTAKSGEAATKAA